jgi:hypothetical protein
LIPESWLVVRAHLGRATQQGGPPEILNSLRADLRAARARDYLSKVLAAEPPLPAEYRRELARILSGAER